MPCMASGGQQKIWAAGGVALGGWNVIGNPFAAELVCRSGVDWLGVDLQRRPHPLSALRSSGSLPFAWRPVQRSQRPAAASSDLGPDCPEER